MIDINELRQALGAVQPEEVEELLDRLEAVEKERDFAKTEIARLHDDIRELTDERVLDEEDWDQIVTWRQGTSTKPAPGVPDGVAEALQRLIENGAVLGPASSEDALLVARYRQRLLACAPSVPDGWKEAAIAWEVCASIHREYGKGKDPFFNTRQGDFVKHANDARAMLAAAPKQEAQPAPIEQDTSVRKAWARFSHELNHSPDAPYPGMSEAFEQHFSQSFTDREWRAESATWAAAWKAAKRHEAQAQPAPSMPECPYPCGWQNLLKHVMGDGAYLARSINEDEPVTENARAVTMRMVMRLRDVLMAINNTSQKAKP